MRWTNLDAEETPAGIGTVGGEGGVSMRAGNARFDESEFSRGDGETGFFTK